MFQVLFCRLRYKLSYREVSERFLRRGFVFTHEIVRDWKKRFTPIWADRLRTQHRGKTGQVWHVDKTSVKSKGRWCYLYRAMDQGGNLVDSRLAGQREMAVAQAFFTQAKHLVGQAPERMITDGHTPYPRAITEVLGSEVVHVRVSCCVNPIEQDHRGLKQRYSPMLGFKTFEAAQHFCRVFEEVRQYLRPRRWMGQFVSLAQRRVHLPAQVAELHSLFAPA